MSTTVHAFTAWLAAALAGAMAATTAAPTSAQPGRDLAAYSRGYCDATNEGAEGRLPASAARRGLSLALVQVAVRHGDRAPLGQVPGTVADPARHWSCALDDAERGIVASFERNTVRHAEDLRPFVRSLAPQPDDLGNCLPGRLTGRGIVQQASLGQHLGRAYRKLLGLDEWRTAQIVAERVYVRATRYVRTQQSAAALLWGMLPGESVRVDVLFHQDDADEVMLGMQAACPRALRAAESQAREDGSATTLGEALEDLFGDGPQSLGIDPFVDAVFTSTCHGLALPCGRGGCMDVATGAGVANAGANAMCARYTGKAGGTEATALGIQPFLAEIAARMRRTAGAGPGAALRLALYSGHDTVVGPVLAGLGAFDCNWPGYASRVVFELWSKRGDPDATGGSEHWVRVLYDGQPVTGRIPHCSRAAGRSADDALCPLEAFEAATRAPLGEARTWEAACALAGPG